MLRDNGFCRSSQNSHWPATPTNARLYGRRQGSCHGRLAPGWNNLTAVSANEGLRGRTIHRG